MENITRAKMTSCLALLVAVISLCESASTCDQDVRVSYLNGAMYMVAKAKYNLAGNPMDCSDLLHMGQQQSGVFTVQPASRLFVDESLEVYCDMQAKGGGWTVIQRRGDYGNPKNFFTKDWKSYKKGFGKIEKDFWLGNDNIFALTNQKLYTARIYLKDVDNNTRYAEYSSFWIDDESNHYTLHVSGYSGNAGDGLAGHHNNQKFSTEDKDNDNLKDTNCAKLYKGGWWYNACHTSSLNGLYIKGKHESYADGVAWLPWKSFYESVVYAEIKIRPQNFKLP